MGFNCSVYFLSVNAACSDIFSIKDLIEKGLKVAILSMKIPDTLKTFLEGKENHATRVVSKKS